MTEIDRSIEKPGDEAARPSPLIARIDRERLAGTLLELIAIPSVNPFGGALSEGRGEVAAADYVQGRLRRLGWRAEVTEFNPGRANVLAVSPSREGSSRAAVVLAGHLDTVEVDGYDQPFAGRLENGRIHGRGACDMKAAIACYIEVAEVLAEAGVELTAPLAIAGVADEEFQQRGAKAVRAVLPRAELVVIGEPTELRICTAAKGLAAYTLAVEGAATHGSVPHAGRNAIVQAARMLEAVEAHAAALRSTAHPLLGPPVQNIGVIRGGLKPNIVPSSCEVEISRRLLPDETPDSARAGLFRRLCQCHGEPQDWSLSEAWWSVDPYENRDAEIVGAFRRAVAAAGAPWLDVSGFPASSDAAYFGAPVVIYGPGSLDQAHSLDEWVEVEDMVTAAGVYLQFALDRLAANG
jgi:acetylornithine deacetylase